MTERLRLPILAAGILALLIPAQVLAFGLEPSPVQKIQRAEYIASVRIIEAGEPATAQVVKQLKGDLRAQTIKVRNVPKEVEDSGHTFVTGEKVVLYLAFDPVRAEYVPAFGSFGVSRTSRGVADALKALEGASLDERRQALLSLLGSGSTPPTVARQTIGLDVLRRGGSGVAPLRKDPGVQSSVIALLHSRDPALRRDASYVLGSIQAKEGVPALIDTLDDPDPAVVEASSDALRKLTGRVDGTLDKPMTPTNRKEIVARWKTWYTKEGATKFPRPH